MTFNQFGVDLGGRAAFTDLVLVGGHVFQEVQEADRSAWIELRAKLMVASTGRKADLHVASKAVLLPLFFVEYKDNKEAALRQLLYSFQAAYDLFELVDLKERFVIYGAVVDTVANTIAFRALTYENVSAAPL